MREMLRTFLTALAVLSLGICGNPAAADRASAEAREAALARVGERLPGAAENLRGLPTAELLLLANAPESVLHACNDALVALIVIACVLITVSAIVTIVIISKVQRAHRHFGGP